MNNEPIAYLVKAPDGEYLVFEHTEHPVMADCTYIPLYTHPAKTLTDEDIASTWDDVRKDATLKSSMKDIQDFARAILRKAQEK
jgi:hypothetical protein